MKMVLEATDSSQTSFPGRGESIARPVAGGGAVWMPAFAGMTESREGYV